MRRQVDRHVFVTGASRGIGRAIALRLGAEGATLSLSARKAADLGDVADEARRLGSGPVGIFPADVGENGAVEAAIDAAVASHGPLRAAIAVAGIGGPNAAGAGDRFDELVRVNLGGTYRTLRAAEHQLAKGVRGDLVAFSSILGRFGVSGYTGYCASKTGILGLVRALAMELAPRGIQVNALTPGWVATDMAFEGIDGIAKAINGTREKALSVAMKSVPMGRMSTPEDVAGVVAWLLSDDARGVTGQGIDVNNGAWMG
jgi:NAD(P)-dependent dehydrogenase (short-subunit alcohol dehydrogenase family)